jgi:hypothetical protein
MRKLLELLESKVVQPIIGEQYDIGFSWDSPGGERVIKGKHKDKFLVSRPGIIGHEILDPSDIDFEIKKDKANVAFLQKQAGIGSIEKAEKSKREDTDGFADQFTGAKRKRVIDTLLQTVRFNGLIKTRKQEIRELVSNGAKIGKWRGKRSIEKADGSFLGEVDLTKIGIDYAEYLMGKNFTL